jgi:hypothetical protein
MNAERMLRISRRIYGWLQALYPKEHQLEYGREMTQLFADQCRFALEDGGRFGLLALWGRTLVDVCKTAVIEHFYSPQANLGFLQATPGAPLPWRGVVLVLIPGIMLLVGQVGQLTGNNWYFDMLAWAGYAFMIPVLLVWWHAGKFPVWGLIPLGLFFRAVESIVTTRLAELSVILSQNALVRTVQAQYDLPGGKQMLVILFGYLALVITLAWVVYRRERFTRSAWLWLAIFALIALAKPLMDVFKTVEVYMLLQTQGHSFLRTTLDGSLSRTFSTLSLSYPAAIFLVLVFTGALLARHHGRLAMLLLIGYLLPTVVYGYYYVDTYSFPDGLSPAWINAAVLVYRLSLAVIAPLWVVRSASQRGQALGVAIPVVLALAAQVGLAMAFGWFPVDIAYMIAGMILATVLYKDKQQAFRAVQIG